MKNNPKIIVITGAESTGKSELATKLANYFNVPFIPELARDYVEKLDRKYNYSDIENIAREQTEQIHALKKQNTPLVFVDTWLIITKVWFEIVFQKSPDWIEQELRHTFIDLFLVCHTDLPWIPDPVRENGGKQRLILQKMYIDNLNKYNFNYEIVTGTKELRFKNALKHVSQL